MQIKGFKAAIVVNTLEAVAYEDIHSEGNTLNWLQCQKAFGSEHNDLMKALCTTLAAGRGLYG
jgi:hypothetical protein